MRSKPIPPFERLMVNVTKTESCWTWNLSKDLNGYGQMMSQGKLLRAHRVSWEFHNGPIPAGINVLHRCDNPSCVRPDHLFLGTQADNINDMHQKNRGNHGAKNGKARLTLDQVLEIRHQRSLGVTPREMAIRFGVTAKHIGAIAGKRYWKKEI